MLNSTLLYSVSFLLGRLSLKMIENFEKFGKSSVIDMEMVRLIICQQIFCCSKLLKKIENGVYEYALHHAYIMILYIMLACHVIFPL